jgi:hypothetical protein
MLLPTMTSLIRFYFDLSLIGFWVPLIVFFQACPIVFFILLYFFFREFYSTLLNRFLFFPSLPGPFLRAFRLHAAYTLLLGPHLEVKA